MLTFLLNLLMLSRISYTFDDDKISFKQIPYYLIIQGIGIAALAINHAWIGLLASIVIMNVLIIIWERKTKNTKAVRIVSLLLFSIMYALFINISGNITINQALMDWVKRLNDNLSIVDNLNDLSGVNTYSLGFLFILNESNTIIRQLFEWLQISPVNSEKGKAYVDIIPPADKYIKIDEYKSGRVIGILERVFVYFAVVLSEYSIIGFILAAKAFARFKELEKKAYAEYVLIGTLSSILISFIVASFITSLLK